MISANFPKYTAFDPAVPVWCITPDIDGCVHRFFDASSVSPSGRYVALTRFRFEDRMPVPGAPCDMNCDGVVNAFDIEPFLDLLFGGGEPCDSCTGDANDDGDINAFDIEPFLNCLFP